MLRILVTILLAAALAAPAFAQDSVTSLPLPSDDGTSSSSEDPGPPPPCNGETISIARMQWPTAQLLAEIHARLIRQNFGCDVDVVPGDLAATASSMGANGQPAVAPELWITRVSDVWNGALKTQEVRQAGAAYADAVFEGWFVPDYEVAARPDLKGVDGLKAYWKDFAVGGKKGRFISCPPDWGCAVVNRNLLRANGLEGLFDVVEPANRFELDTLIAEAVSRKEPILFYYWQPNAVLAQFPFKQLDLGPYNKDNFLCLGRVACADPKPSGFAPDQVIVALAQWVYLDSARGRGLFPARPHAVCGDECAAAEPQRAGGDDRERRRRVRRGARRGLAAMGGQGCAVSRRGSSRGQRAAVASGLTARL